MVENKVRVDFKPYVVNRYSYNDETKNTWILYELWVKQKSYDENNFVIAFAFL